MHFCWIVFLELIVCCKYQVYLNNEKKIVHVSQKKAKQKEQDQKMILMMYQSQISKYNAKYYLVPHLKSS